MNNIYFLNETITNNDPINYILGKNSINTYSNSLCEKFENEINGILNSYNESVVLNENKITDILKKIITAIINFFKKGIDFILRIIRGSDKKYSECMQKLRTIDSSEKFNIALLDIPSISKVPSNDIVRFIKETGNKYIGYIRNDNKYTAEDAKEIFNNDIARDFIKILSNICKDTPSNINIEDISSFDKFIKEHIIITSEKTKDYSSKDLYNYLKNNPNYGDRYFATPMKNTEKVVAGLSKINMNNKEQSESLINIIAHIVKPLCQYFTTLVLQIQSAQKHNLEVIYNAINKNSDSSSDDNEKSTDKGKSKFKNKEEILKKIEKIVDEEVDKLFK